MRRKVLLLIGLLLLSQSVFSSEAAPSSQRRAAMLERRLERREKRLQRRNLRTVHPSSSSVPSSSHSSSNVASQQSSAPSLAIDARPDTDIRSHILLLGETTPILAKAKVFLEEEPIEIESITVNTTLDVSQTVQALLVYDGERRLLGRATLDRSSGTNKKYTVTVPDGTVVVPKRSERSYYVRAQLGSRSEGGQSDQTIQVNNFIFEATGVWSTLRYTKASSDTFRAFETARSRITRIANAKASELPLVAGTQRELGSFTFEGAVTDGTALLRLSALTFTIEQTGGISVSNVSLGADGVTSKHSCTVSSSLVSCTSISDVYGALEGGIRTLTLYGTVTIPSGVTSAHLRLTLNEPGDIFNAGSVTWSDGTSTFTWVDLDSPVASGTLWSQ